MTNSDLCKLAQPEVRYVVLPDRRPVSVPAGTVFYFGLPDDDSYPINMRTMLRNNLTLKSGVTLQRRRALGLANEFAAEHPSLLPSYLTHTFGIDDVQAAFELACRPVPGRVKIAITESGLA